MIPVTKNTTDLSIDVVQQKQGEVDIKELGRMVCFEKLVQNTIKSINKTLYGKTLEQKKQKLSYLWDRKDTFYPDEVEAVRRLYTQIYGEKPHES